MNENPQDKIEKYNANNNLGGNGEFNGLKHMIQEDTLKLT